MGMSEFELLAKRIEAAKNPEEIFGPLGSAEDPVKAGRSLFRYFSKLTHPDLNSDGAASITFARLSVLWDQAEQKLQQGTYGVIEPDVDVTTPVVIKRGRTAYQVMGQPYPAGFSSLYRCSFSENGTGQVGVLKIVQNEMDNDLLQNEARLLRHLKDGKAFPKHNKFFPDLVDSFLYKDASGSDSRQVNIFRRDEYPYYSLSEIKQLYPQGIDSKDASWIWRRLLFSTGVAHQNDLVHGAVLPPNILIQPENHGLVLNEWSYGVLDPSVSGEVISAVDPDFESWYPEEVFKKVIPIPGLDIYLGAKSLIDLMGGDSEKGILPDSVHPRIRAFFRGCVLPNSRQRPQDAWRLLGEFDSLISSVWGPRKFHHFGVPVNTFESPYR